MQTVQVILSLFLKQLSFDLLLSVHKILVSFCWVRLVAVLAFVVVAPAGFKRSQLGGYYVSVLGGNRVIETISAESTW